MKAHIRLQHERAYCGVSVSGDEFMFSDAGYALLHYANVRGDHLGACKACCAEVRLRQENENKIS